MTRLILTIITVYLLCWLPHWAVQLLLMFGPPGDVSLLTTDVLMLSLVRAALPLTHDAAGVGHLLPAVLKLRHQPAALQLPL